MNAQLKPWFGRISWATASDYLLITHRSLPAGAGDPPVPGTRASGQWRHRRVGTADQLLHRFPHRRDDPDREYSLVISWLASPGWQAICYPHGVCGRSHLIFYRLSGAFFTCRGFVNRPGAQYPLWRGDQWYWLWSGLPRAWHQWWHRYPGAHYQQLAQHSPLPKLPDHRFLDHAARWAHLQLANALYAIIMLFISGIAAEVTTEGPNVVRTAFIITD